MKKETIFNQMFHLLMIQLGATMFCAPFPFFLQAIGITISIQNAAYLIIEEVRTNQQIHNQRREMKKETIDQEYFRPKTRGELVRKIKSGTDCEVANHTVSITKILLNGWLEFDEFTVKPSTNEGWSVFSSATT